MANADDDLTTVHVTVTHEYRFEADSDEIRDLEQGDEGVLDGLIPVDSPAIRVEREEE